MGAPLQGDRDRAGQRRCSPHKGVRPNLRKRGPPPRVATSPRWVPFGI